MQHPITPLRELQLVEAHRRGDPEAIGGLLRAYERRIHAICYRMARHEEDARDLTQEAMLKVIQGLDSYDGRSKLSTWVIRVTMNTCLSFLRKQRLRQHRSLDQPPAGVDAARPPQITPPDAEPGPGQRVERNEELSILSRALRALAPESRALLVLRDMQDLEYHRIAEVLDVPVGTVKSRLFRARLALRSAMELETRRAVDDEAAAG